MWDLIEIMMAVVPIGLWMAMWLFVVIWGNKLTVWTGKRKMAGWALLLVGGAMITSTLFSLYLLWALP